MLVQLEALADDAGKLALEKIYAVLLPLRDGHADIDQADIVRRSNEARGHLRRGAGQGQTTAENMSFEWVGQVSDGLDQSYVCASYVFYAKSRMQRPRDNGIMTDKGIPHGLPI